jgi:hypothetical protein
MHLRGFTVSGITAIFSGKRNNSGKETQIINLRYFTYVE